MNKILVVVVVIVLALFCSTLHADKQPHIIAIMIDDLGVANVGFSAKFYAKNLPPDPLWYEVHFRNYTPNLDRMADEGIILTRHYAYSVCTPTRMSFLTGRLPVHMGVHLVEADAWDGGLNPTAGYSGAPPNVTSIAHQMKMRGYRTHFVGKTDGLGMATERHIPVNRGFDSSLNFFHHSNDIWNYTLAFQEVGVVGGVCFLKPGGREVVDLWNNNHTAKGTTYYNCPVTSTNCSYEERLFTDRVIQIIDQHPNKEPLFLWYATRSVHTPLEPLDDYLHQVQAECGNVTGATFPSQCVISERQKMLAFMRYLDVLMGEIESALKRRGMWEDTLLFFMSDNGAQPSSPAGGNNYPLRGGKGSNWEGGMRVPAFLSGGFIPKNLRGTTNDLPMHVADWYGTFCELANRDNKGDDDDDDDDDDHKKRLPSCTGYGADPTGDAAGIPPVDSVNLWPYITKKASGSPHPFLHLAPNALLMTAFGRDYKLVTGILGNYLLTSPNYPNCTYNLTCSGSTCCAPGERPSNPTIYYGQLPLPYDCGEGCLYDLTSDMTESVNLCTSNPTVCTVMKAMLTSLNQSFWEPFRGCVWPDLVCPVYAYQWNSTYGPFVNVPNCNNCFHTTADYKLHPTFPQTTNDCQCHGNLVTCMMDEMCQWSVVNKKCDLSSEFAGKTYTQLNQIRSRVMKYFDNTPFILD